MECLGSTNKKGKVVGGSTSRLDNFYVSFKSLNLLFQIASLLPIGFFNMSYFPLVVTFLLLSIFLGRFRFDHFLLNIMVDRLSSSVWGILLTSFFRIFPNLVFKQVSLILYTKLTFIMYFFMFLDQ